jgi:hypothetical protein
MPAMPSNAHLVYMVFMQNNWLRCPLLRLLDPKRHTTKEVAYWYEVTRLAIILSCLISDHQLLPIHFNF